MLLKLPWEKESHQSTTPATLAEKRISIIKVYLVTFSQPSIKEKHDDVCDGITSSFPQT